MVFAFALAALFLMFEFQSQLIFPTHAVPRAGPLPRDAELLHVTTPDGETLAGVHIPPIEKHAAGDTLILGFAGNAWNAQDAAEYLHEVLPHADVVAFHYRGYAPSTGAPSGEALVADAPLVYDAAVQRVRPRRIVGVGLSIGTGVAAQLTLQRRIDGLILVTPFDSLKALAQSLYPWLPIAPLFRHQIDAAGALAGSDVPAALIVAERDEIVSAARTEALRRKVGNLVFDRTIRGAGHNDIYGRSEFQQALEDGLSAVTK